MQSLSTGSPHPETGTAERLFLPEEDAGPEPGNVDLHHPVLAVAVVSAVDAVAVVDGVAVAAVGRERQSPAQVETVFPSRGVEQQSGNC